MAVPYTRKRKRIAAAANEPSPPHADLGSNVPLQIPQKLHAASLNESLDSEADQSDVSQFKSPRPHLGSALVAHLPPRTHIPPSEIPPNYGPLYSAPAWTPPVTSNPLDHSSEKDVKRFRSELGISVEGIDVPRPISRFEHHFSDPRILQILSSHRIDTPTSIQMQAIPAISAGRDVIGLAPTGSGKTLAFVLPFMARLWGFTPSGPGEGPRAMIVVPTRELADQVYAVVRMFSEVERTGFTERGAPHEGGFGDQWWTVYDGQTDYDGGTGVQWWKGYEGQAQCDGGTGEGTGTDSSAYNGQIADQYADGWTAASENHGWEVVNHTADENAHYFEPVANPHKFCSTSYLSSSFHHPNAGTRASYRVLGATGGIPIQSQIQPIRKLGVDVLIGTPGRLIDLFSRGDVRLDRLSYIVLDEVDRMLTLNMEEQLRWILDQIDRTLTPRQCVMFSATLTHHLEQVALGAVFNPITIRTSKTSTSTKPSTSSSSANEDLSASVGSSSEATLEPKQENTGQAIEERVVYFNNRHQKYKLLLKCLRSTPYPPVIVFCNSAKTVDKLTQQLRSEQFHVAGLHSKKNQPYRFRVMSYMRNGTCDVLVATDLVSRGIDIPACTHVINYDVPRTNTVEHEDDSEIEMHGSDSFDSYVHRIGRTARGPSGKGVATTFWFSGEEAHPNPRLDRRLLKCNEIYL